MRETRDESRAAVKELAQHGPRYYAALDPIYDRLARGRYFPTAELDARMDEELAQKTKADRAAVERLTAQILELEQQRNALAERIRAVEGTYAQHRNELDQTYVELLQQDAMSALGIADDPLRFEFWARAEELIRVSTAYGELIGPHFYWYVIEQLALMVEEEGYRRTILVDLRDGRWMTERPPKEQAAALWRQAGIPEPLPEDWATKTRKA